MPRYRRDGGGANICARDLREGATFHWATIRGCVGILKELKTAPPVPGARTNEFIDNVAVLFSPELASNMTDIANIVGWA